FPKYVQKGVYAVGGNISDTIIDYNSNIFVRKSRAQSALHLKGVMGQRTLYKQDLVHSGDYQ
ncbi:MAG: hypothetical protein ACKO6K_11240, partial [Chitinophagaceae bacterium]